MNWPRADQHAPTVDGVTLASLHSAKGLEWDAVFLVGLAEGTLPTTYAKTPEALEEERRLLYVGITRARQWLWLSYAGARSPGGRQRRPSRFLPALEPRRVPVAHGSGAPEASARRHAAGASTVVCRVCGAALLGGAERKLGRCADCPSDVDEELLERLRDWRPGRRAAARRSGVRRLHRRDPDRAGRAAADQRRRHWSTSPASGHASSACTARRCSRWSPARASIRSGPDGSR